MSHLVDQTLTEDDHTSHSSAVTHTRQVDLNILHDKIKAYVAGFIKQHDQVGSSSSLTTVTPADSQSQLYWQEVKHGIYFLKVGSDLALPSFHKAEELMSSAIREAVQYDLPFLQDLFLTISPVNVRIQPEMRQNLLRQLDTKLMDIAPNDHPLRTIIAELKYDNNNADVSEDATDYLLECINSYKTSHAHVSELSEQAIRIECATIALLRRDGQLRKAAVKASALLAREEAKYRQLDSESHIYAAQRPMRLAATELFHVHIVQGHEHDPEAVELGLLILTGRRWNNSKGPCWPPSVALLEELDLIQDGKNIHALECMAKICEARQEYGEGVEWLLLAKEMPVELSTGHDNDVVIKHIDEKITKFEEAGRDD